MSRKSASSSELQNLCDRIRNKLHFERPGLEESEISPSLSKVLGPYVISEIAPLIAMKAFQSLHLPFINVARNISQIRINGTTASCTLLGCVPVVSEENRNAVPSHGLLFALSSSFSCAPFTPRTLCPIVSSWNRRQFRGNVPEELQKAADEALAAVGKTFRINDPDIHPKGGIALADKHIAQVSLGNSKYPVLTENEWLNFHLYGNPLPALQSGMRHRIAAAHTVPLPDQIIPTSPDRAANPHRIPT